MAGRTEPIASESPLAGGPPPAGRWLAAGASRRGSARRTNEDSWTVLPAAGDRPLLLAVADGVGGEAAGEEASAAAIAALTASWESWRPAGRADGAATREALLRAARAADAAVRRLATEVPRARGAASTLTAVAAGADDLAVVHAGDSRAYLLAGGTARALTADHTWVAEHPEAPPAVAESFRHVITRFLGQPDGCPFDARVEPLSAGATLLLCSDGVSNVVPAAALAGATAGTAESGASAVLSLVEAADGADDATVVVAVPASPGAAPQPAEDPFGLGGLLKGQPRAQRPRRLTRAAWLAGGGLAALAVAGAGLAPRLSETLRRPFRPPPGPEAEAYLAAWAAGDLDALYGRLTPEARRATDRDAFRQQHLDLAATMTLQRLTLTPATGGAAPAADGDGAGVPFRAVYATDRFGELRRDNVLPLRWRDGAWWVAWTPEVLLPDLAGGRTLRAFPDAAGRGGVLDRQRRPLAVSPPGGPRRQYPQGPLAGPLTGYVDGDSAGRAGLEAATDDLLAGHPGGRLTVLAPSGEIASTLSSAPARPGETVTLTLDLDLQRACEAALGERAGSVVVLDARDGAVLALASYPQYDPNTFVTGGDVGAILTDPRQPLVNRPLVGLYPPGSIFKAVTMAAGLERGVVRPDSEFVCTGRWTGLPGLSFDCWLRTGHGRLNLVSGLTQSCNCVFYEVGKLLDEQEANALPDVAVRSGFGGATGTVPGLEPGGTVPSPQWKRQALNDGWARGDAVNMAIGQGQLLVTPLQVAALYAAIAGGGQRRGPRLLDRAQLPGGNVERLLPPAAKPPLPWSAATLEAIRGGLRGVVGAAGGTAAAVFQGSPLAGVTAGKTGTAESGGGRQPHAWFAGYAPVDAPQVVVLAMLEYGGEGSQAAAPLARGVLETALAGYARYTGSA